MKHTVALQEALMSLDVNRRRFVQLATGSAAMAAVGGFGFTAGAAASPKPAGWSAGGAGNPLRIPPALVAVDGTLSTGLTAQAARVQIGGPERLSDVLAYNQSFPGPTLILHRGESLEAALRNGLADPTTIHWHGLVVPTMADGQPKEAVAAGETYTYAYRVAQRAALNFYHPHPHMKTGSQVYLGLAGALVVRDAVEDALGLPSGRYEVPLILRDASFDSAGNLSYGGKASGFFGKFPMVNGTLDPVLSVDSGVYRFRVVNAATARIFRLERSDGQSFTLIGNDGGLLRKAVEMTAIEVSPGERVDLLLDFTSIAGTVVLRCGLAGWDLLRLSPSGNVGIDYQAPAKLSVINQLVQDGAARRFSFDGMSRINGKTYDLDRIDFQVPAGAVEKWTFATNGNAPHPVHVHGASFQVVARRYGRSHLFPWEAGWKDTVLLHDREEVDVLIRFAAGLSGQRYLIHCHKLEHEDAGMMANFKIV